MEMNSCCYLFIYLLPKTNDGSTILVFIFFFDYKNDINKFQVDSSFGPIH